MKTILNIPLSDYLGDPAPEPSLTRSLIVTLLNQHPKAAWYEHPRLNPERPDDDANKATDMGSAAHALLLEGREVFEVIDADNYRTKAAQEARDAARESGKHPLLVSDWQDLQNMHKVAKETLEKSGIPLDTGIPEQSIVWQSGCWLRTRPDWTSQHKETVLEYKTTTLSRNDWIRGMASKGYDIQAAMHRAGTKCERVIFAVQNTEPPYSMFFVELSALYYELAERKISRAVDIWSKCLEANFWPDYGTETTIVDPSSWQLAQEEERAIEHEGWSKEAFLFGRVKGD